VQVIYFFLSQFLKPRSTGAECRGLRHGSASPFTLLSYVFIACVVPRLSLASVAADELLLAATFAACGTFFVAI